MNADNTSIQKSHTTVVPVPDLHFHYLAQFFNNN